MPPYLCIDPKMNSTLQNKIKWLAILFSVKAIVVAVSLWNPAFLGYIRTVLHTLLIRYKTYRCSKSALWHKLISLWNLCFEHWDVLKTFCHILQWQRAMHIIEGLGYKTCFMTALWLRFSTFLPPLPPLLIVAAWSFDISKWWSCSPCNEKQTSVDFYRSSFS